MMYVVVIETTDYNTMSGRSGWWDQIQGCGPYRSYEKAEKARVRLQRIIDRYTDDGGLSASVLPLDTVGKLAEAIRDATT